MELDISVKHHFDVFNPNLLCFIPNRYSVKIWKLLKVLEQTCMIISPRSFMHFYAHFFFLTVNFMFMTFVVRDCFYILIMGLRPSVCLCWTRQTKLANFHKKEICQIFFSSFQVRFVSKCEFWKLQHATSKYRMYRYNWQGHGIASSYKL